MSEEDLSLSRRLAAILFSDMVGYSAMSQTDESRALRLLDEHRRLLRSIFSKHNGIEIKTIGDAFLVEFGSAVQAVRCAVEIQETLARRNRDRADDDEIQIRVGIHLGDVVHTGDDILGDGVNIAARVYPLAQPGGICVTEDVARQVRNKLDHPLRRLESVPLKNITLPVEVYVVELPWLPKADSSKKGVSPRSAAAREKGKKKSLIMIGTGLVVVLAVAGLYVSTRLSRSAGPNRRTIAVLPFANMSGHTDDEYFSDGITEDILTQLCKIADLDVISRTTMMRYKGTNKNLREIGKELKAGVILQGSVRRVGDRVRIASQLIDAAGDKTLWAESYDREMSNILLIQSDVAEKIAAALDAKLSPTEKARLKSAAIADANAYNLFLQGRYFVEQVNRENTDKAISLFQQALAIAPADTKVWAALSQAYIARLDFASPEDARNILSKARDAAVKALALDDSSAEGHSAMGLIKNVYDWDWQGADAEFKKALALEPGNVPNIRFMGALESQLGHLDEAKRLIKKATDLDPVSPVNYFDYAVILIQRNDLEDAVPPLEKALELNPQGSLFHRVLGSVKLLQGRLADALAEMRKEPEEFWRWQGLALVYDANGQRREADAVLADLIKIYAEQGSFQIAEIYAFRGEAGLAFEWLDKAFAVRDPGLGQIRSSPFLNRLKSDPRYTAFMKKMKLI